MASSARASSSPQFFCKYNEPGAVKFLKMSCLPHIANPANAREIVAELTEYVSGVDIELARKAVRAIGEIAIRVPVAAEVVVESMLELVEMEAEYVRAETVIVMQGEGEGLCVYMDAEYDRSARRGRVNEGVRG